MSEAELYWELHPWQIQCLYLNRYWETLGRYATKEEAEKDLPRYMVRGRDRSRYRIINIHDNH